MELVFISESINSVMAIIGETLPYTVPYFLKSVHNPMYANRLEK